MLHCNYFVYFCLFTYSFDKHLLNTYYILAVVLEKSRYRNMCLSSERSKWFYENSVVHIIKGMIIEVMKTLRRRLSPNLEESEGFLKGKMSTLNLER